MAFPSRQTRGTSSRTNSLIRQAKTERLTGAAERLRRPKLQNCIEANVRRRVTPRQRRQGAEPVPLSSISPNHSSRLRRLPVCAKWAFLNAAIASGLMSRMVLCWAP